jgi:site-specific DNA-methyltransferase (adenine-specific)
MRIDNIDAVSWLRRIKHGRADLIITDPAYESLEKHRSKGTTTRLKKSKASSNEWFEIFRNDRFEEFFIEAHCVLKKNAHLYMLCDQETMFVVKPIAEAVGFKFWKAIIWDKDAIGMGYHYRARHEMVLFFEKGKRKLNDLSVPDVLTFKRLINKCKCDVPKPITDMDSDLICNSCGKAIVYPTQKPVGLLEVLVKQSSSEGDLVIDPFVGSGSTGVAAANLGRDFMGTDRSDHAVSTSKMRVEDAINRRAR